MTNTTAKSANALVNPALAPAFVPPLVASGIILVMRAWEGMTFTDAAKQLGVTVGVVLSQVFDSGAIKRVRALSDKKADLEVLLSAMSFCLHRMIVLEMYGTQVDALAGLNPVSICLGEMHPPGKECDACRPMLEKFVRDGKEELSKRADAAQVHAMVCPVCHAWYLDAVHAELWDGPARS